MSKPSESVRILLALIDANLDNVTKETFEGFTFHNELHGLTYKQAYKDGARECLNKLKKQLLGEK